MLIPPRLMTADHPRCVGSFGSDAIAFARANARQHVRRSAGPLPWQELALSRALEHDADGQLLWRTVIVSAPRQVGKSYLERMVCSWRLRQGERFGEPQDILHVAHKLQAAQEVWRPAAHHDLRMGARVRWTNGEQQTELEDGSRWLIQAANDGAGVAFSLSMVLVDEAWRVPRRVVDGAIAPTMAEAQAPQLWLVSTAGTSDSDLMMASRARALDALTPGVDASVLILEWSAPPDEDLDIGDPAVWRAASPNWSDRRADVVRDAFEGATEWEFRQQWLNQWVPTVSAPMFDALAWQSNAWAGAYPSGALSFGVDVAADRSRAVIVGLCGGVAEVVDDRAGAGWCAQRLTELARSWHPVAIGVDIGGPAATVADQLAADLDVADLVVRANGRDMATASGRVFDAITGGELVATRSSAALAGAVASARRRVYGQSWVFDRLAPDGVALVALTAAQWAAERQPDMVEASAIW